MSLEKDFIKFANEKQNQLPALEKVSQVKDLKKKFVKALAQNKDKIDISIAVAKTLTSFSQKKTPFVLIEGVLNLAKDAVDREYKAYQEDYFSAEDGWVTVSDTSWIIPLLKEAILAYPYESKFAKYSRSTISRIYTLPFCKVGHVQYSNHSHAFYYWGKLSESEFENAILDESIATFSGNMISLEQGEKSNIRLVDEALYTTPSLNADKHARFIQSFFDKGMNRSIVFYGPPGTGKTTLSQTIIKNFNLRTLKFRYNENLSFTLCRTLIRKLKIEAILIDDFDQIPSTNRLFEFLEFLKKEVKLVIAIVNSLKEFHPAVLRPGRFDNIILIDSLDEATVRTILGPDLADLYFDKVKKWPIAYINELMNMYKAFGSKELETSFNELNDRVNSAEKYLKA